MKHQIQKFLAGFVSWIGDVLGVFSETESDSLPYSFDFYQLSFNEVESHLKSTTPVNSQEDDLKEAVEIERLWQAEKMAKLEQKKTPSEYFSHESVAPLVRQLTFLSETLATLNSLENLAFPGEMKFLESRRDIIETSLKSSFIGLFQADRPAPETKAEIWERIALLKNSKSQERDESDFDLVVIHSPHMGTHVEGDTRKYKEELKASGLRWKPKHQYWGLLNTVGKTPNFDRIFKVAMKLFGTGLRVRIEISDQGSDEYKKALVVYLNEKSEIAQCRSDRALERSTQSYERSKYIADGIPMGQPILVGHHSEKRHRRDIEKMDRAMGQSVAAARKSEYLESKAEGYSRKADALAEELDPEQQNKKVEQLKMVANLQEMIRKSLKKVSPVVASCRKDCEGKGKRSWSFYTITFHDERMNWIRIHFVGNKVGICRYSDMPDMIVITDAQNAFEYLEKYLERYIKETYRPLEIANDKMACKFGVDSYWMEDRVDHKNMPKAIDHKEPKKILLKTFKWALNNEDKIKGMNFSDVIRAVANGAGACPHQYCSMD